MNKPRVVAIIPARGGSKRLPRKNIYPFFGRPLLTYAIEACQHSIFFGGEIYVSTEDPEIAAVAKKWGADVIERPRELATDTVWTQDVLKHAVRKLEGQGKTFDVVVRVQANSPQVQAEKIDEAIEKLLQHDRWEIFSVDEQGLEDAAIHVMKRDVVFQASLGVYKGVVTTNYIDVHAREDIEKLEAKKIGEIEKASQKYLAELHREALGDTWVGWWQHLIGRRRLSLWGWQRQIPLARRWQLILEAAPHFRGFLQRNDAYEHARDMAVLDLGCGFGMYWPILREYGFRKFMGVDLFDRRGHQRYFEAAKRYVKRFCADCETRIIMDDVRNLDDHTLMPATFDVILNVATTSTKAGSTGVPFRLLREVVEKYGKKDCMVVDVAKAH